MKRKIRLLAIPARYFLLSTIFLLFVFTISAQKTVTGTVKENNQPILGASVEVKGTNVATLTDANGNFSITLPAGKTVLIVSYVGMGTQTVDIGTKTSIDVILAPLNTTLNEVVVTGYTAQRKKEITGAVTVVNIADLKAMPAADASSQLQGRAAGVTVVQSGVPGAAATVRIRGLSSFQNNNPLYVVDGVQMGNISAIPPSDIESIQVLKDAAAVSIYGVRASNGVVVVTTKRPKKRGVSVNYDMYYGIQNPGEGLEMLNAQEEAELAFLARRNSGLTTTGSVYGNGASPVLPDYIFASGASSGTLLNTGHAAVNPNLYSLDYSRLGDVGYTPYIIVPASKSGTNWYDIVTRNAPIQNHSVSFQNATENSRFYFSANYFDQKAITETQFFKRYAARLNSEFTIVKGLRIGENLQVTGTEANVPQPTGGLFNNSEASIIAQTFRPMAIVPVYTIRDGDFAGNAGGSGWGTWGNAKNPYADLFRRRKDRVNGIGFFGNVYAELDFLNHFTARSSFGGGIFNGNAWSYPFIEYENSENAGNTTYNESVLKVNNWIWTNQISYKNSFGSHNINAIVGQEAQKTGAGRQIIASATGFFVYNNYDFINLTNGTVQNTGGSAIFAPIATLSYFAKADYDYKNKFLASATVRRDGSSKFLGDNRWGTFPAFSLGWRISEEEFMRNMSWVNDFKIRGSWGRMGNEAAAVATNSYTVFSSDRQSSWYDITGTQSNPTEGFGLSFVGNPAGRWETNTSLNIGFDATIFKGSTEIVFDWYTKKTEDLLVQVPGQGIGGGVAANRPAYRNVGSMENKGIDLMIINKANLGNTLKLTSTLTFTSYKNKITNINPEANTTYFESNSPANESNRVGQAATRNMVGSSLNTFYGYQVLGLFQTAAEATAWNQPDAAPGRFKFADINGDKKIDENDRTIIGNANPDFTYGLNFNFDYKAFDLEMFFYGVKGNDIFNFTRWWTDFSPGGFAGGRSKRALYESWLPDGSRPNAKTPIQEASSGGFSASQNISSYYIENGSYLRLRNLQIGYTLPVSLTSKAKITKARIYIQGTNLFTITKYTGLNPESVSTDDRARGVDVSSFPTVKQFIIGASITL